MPVDMYAVIFVRDYASAKAWYARLLGAEPSYVATATEAVWELAEHRSIVIDENADRAGHGMVTIFVDDFDTRLAQISQRGIEPTQRETYRNGVRKALYRDPDGNEVGIGGAPTESV